METNGTVALAKVDSGPNLAAFEPRDLREAMGLAEMLVKSQLMPKHLKNPSDCLLVIITGRELGLSIMQSIRGMHVIEGKVSLSADLIVALVKRHPDCIYFQLTKSTNEEAVYEVQRRGDPTPTKISYTMKQAQEAGLTGKDNWKRHPAAMLRARCSAALARAVFPDGVLGIYDTDEGEEIANKPRRSTVSTAVTTETITADGEVLEGQLAESVDAEQSKAFDALMVDLLDSRSMDTLEAAAVKVSAAVKAQKISGQHRETLLGVYREAKAKLG